MIEANPAARAIWSVFTSDEFDRAITARHLMTPMSQSVSFAEETPASEAASELLRLGFDQAPVGGGDGLRGYTLVRDLLDGPRVVRDAVHPLEPRILVGLDATVETLLNAFRHADMLFMMRRFRDAAVALDPGAHELDEGFRFPIAHPVALAALFGRAGLVDVDTRAIDIPTRFVDFEDFWEVKRHGALDSAMKQSSVLTKVPRRRTSRREPPQTCGAWALEQVLRGVGIGQRRSVNVRPG